MKALLRTFLLLLIFIALIFSFALTPMGLKLGIDLASYLMPGKLTIQKISGVIVGPITIKQLHYENQDETISIGTLQFDWSPADLLKKQIHITQLTANHIHIVTKNNPLPDQWTLQNIEKTIHSFIKTFNPHDLLSVSVDQADISDLQIDTAKQSMHIQLMSLHSRLTKQAWDVSFKTTMQQPQPFSVQFQLKGKPNQYYVQFSIQGTNTNWILSGTGDRNQLSLATQDNKALNGTLDFQLKLNWQAAMQWQGSIHANQLNLSLINANWVNVSLLNINSVGDLKKDFTTATDIRGTVSNGTFHFTIAHQQSWQINWHIKLRALSQWMNKMKGQIESRGKINGDLSDPNFNILLISTLHDRQDKVRHIHTTLVGNFKKQVLRMNFLYRKQKVHIHLEGGWKDNHWLGNLKKLSVITVNHQQWNLEKPARIAFNQQSISTTPLCLKSKNAGDVCIDGKLHDQQIDATVTLNINHFNWLHAWQKHMTIPQGKLEAHFKIKGDINDPLITGALKLHQGRILFPRYNLALNNISASVVSEGKILNFTAAAYSLNQPLQLKGTIDLFHPNLTAQINVTSNNFSIINTAEYSILVSSNLNVSVAGDEVTVTGAIHIPKAIIQPDDYHAVVTLPTNDIVYVGNIVPPPKPFWKTNVDVMVHLGNNVHLKASGITAQLGGSIRIQQSVTDDLFGTGQIIARNGTYSVYGQTLTVSPDSSLSFEHNLIDNPTLNIKASKNIQSMNTLGFSGFSRDSLIVGVELHGSIKEPRITFFSNRGNLSQADILSYLLLGYGSSSNTPGNTDLLIRALSSIDIHNQGLLGKRNIAQQIQSGLGLNELGVESETTVDALGNPLDQQSAFVVGKNLTRNLYVRYSIGLLTPVNVVELRYLFNKNWALQTDSSSLGNGADIVYTIETN